LPSILIFGLFPDSSGKTVVSTALARGLLNRGVNIGVFKPRSGHNLWYQYEAFLKCKAEGRLFCEDIIKLKEASNCFLPYEVLNPVDALMGPICVKTFLERQLINQMYLLEPEVYPHLIVERYTLPREDGKAKTVLVLNEKCINSNFILLDRDYLKRLKKTAEEVISVRSLDEWVKFFNGLASQSIYSCYRMIRQRYETVIVEGFNDAVSIEPRITYTVDVILGVAPGTALLYDTEDFRRVMKVLTELGKDPRALRAKDIVKFLKRYDVLDIPFLPQECLRNYDKLSDSLKDVVDRVESRLEMRLNPFL